MASFFVKFTALILSINSYCIYAGFITTKIGPQPIWNSTDTDKLRQDLLLNYDKFARPAQHYNVTTVSFDLTIRHIELNELKSTLNVHSWLKLKWSDEKLKWNSLEYGGVTFLNLADHEIWQPDIFLYNSATSTAITHYGNVHCKVDENGDVLWVLPAQFQVLCNINLKYWPFDIQNCNLVFGSWTYNGDQIDIEPLNNATTANTKLLINETEWQIVKTAVRKNSKQYSCCPNIHPNITVEIVIKRISPSYTAVIITPAFVLIFLITIVFCFPPDAGEKILLNGCNSIIICLFMIYFSQKIPAMGTHTPLIVLYYRACLFITTAETILCVITIWISRTKHSGPLPWVIKEQLMGTFGKILCLNYYSEQKNIIPQQRVTAEEMRDHQVAEEDESEEDHHVTPIFKKKPLQDDWYLFATALDRIALIFFILLFAILLILYSV